MKAVNDGCILKEKNMERVNHMWFWYVVSFFISLVATFIIYKVTNVILFVFPPLAVMLVHYYFKRKPK